MLARIAQELYWLGRDLMRAEHTARMLDGAFHADVAGGLREGRTPLSWEAVLEIIGAGAAQESAEEAHGRLDVARLLTLQSGTPASIVSCIERARGRAHGLRDVISTEMWEALNGFLLEVRRIDLDGALQTGPYSLFGEIKERCVLFWGLTDRTMLRDEGRSFLEAGGRFEEADMVLRMLRVALPVAGPGAEEAPGYDGEALGLLQAVGGFQAYRRAVRQAPDVGTVARFLLYDETYPGSVAFSIQALRDALSTADAQPRSSPPVLRLGRLLADLELQRRAAQSAPLLAEVLAGVAAELALVDTDIDERYFALAALAAVHT